MSGHDIELGRGERVSEPDIIEQQCSVWDLIAALRIKIERCPIHGMRGQMLNALDALVRAGGAKIITGW